MAFYQWTDQIEIGITAIDDDHRKLVKLVNELHEDLARGHARNAPGKTLDELIKYTRAHFEREERMMQSAAYEGYEAHKSDHDALVARITEFRRDFLAGGAEEPVEFPGYLREWLDSHIQKADREYVSVLGTPAVGPAHPAGLSKSLRCP
jgi:hemerythrin